MFVKVYAAGADLAAEDQAIRLTEFVSAAGVPTADPIRGRNGERIATAAGLAYSVWRFIDAPSGLETGLTHEQMSHVGAVLGRMHRRLAQHAVSLAAPDSRAPLPDLKHTAGAIASLLGDIDRHREDPFRRWAYDALQERAAVLDRIRASAVDSSSYSAQVIHGDLAAPNVLLGHKRITAVIDFSPPRLGAMAHDISRIGCDPRTVLRLGQAWPTALAALATAYRDHNPTVAADDVVGCVRWWLCYTAASTYPVRTLLGGEPSANPGLVVYAQQRHAALMTVLELANDVEVLLRDAVFGRREQAMGARRDAPNPH